MFWLLQSKAKKTFRAKNKTCMAKKVIHCQPTTFYGPIPWKCWERRQLVNLRRGCGAAARNQRLGAVSSNEVIRSRNYHCWLTCPSLALSGTCNSGNSRIHGWFRDQKPHLTQFIGRFPIATEGTHFQLQQHQETVQKFVRLSTSGVAASPLLTHQSYRMRTFWPLHLFTLYRTVQRQSIYIYIY